jgi:hypothetical protein
MLCVSGPLFDTIYREERRLKTPLQQLHSMASSGAICQMQMREEKTSATAMHGWCSGTLQGILLKSSSPISRQNVPVENHAS